ncbi:hypothetical protein IAT38_006389 [Cryptococcus sp. DSM 104549]
MPPFMFQLHSGASTWRTAAQPTSKPVTSPSAAATRPRLSALDVTSPSSSRKHSARPHRTPSSSSSSSSGDESSDDDDREADMPALSRSASRTFRDVSMASTVILTPAETPRHPYATLRSKSGTDISKLKTHAEIQSSADGNPTQVQAGVLASKPLDINNAIGLSVGAPRAAAYSYATTDFDGDSSSASSENSKWSDCIPSWVLKRELVPVCHDVRRDESGRIVLNVRKVAAPAEAPEDESAEVVPEEAVNQVSEPSYSNRTTAWRESLTIKSRAEPKTFHTPAEGFLTKEDRTRSIISISLCQQLAQSDIKALNRSVRWD